MVNLQPSFRAMGCLLDRTLLGGGSDGLCSWIASNDVADVRAMDLGPDTVAIGTNMVPELWAVVAIALMVIAESLHFFRVRRLSALAFGYGRGPTPLGFAAPPLRILAVGAITWALLTLLSIPAKIHTAQSLDEEMRKHVVVLLDVSPSMRLEDAGPDAKQSRIKRGWVVLKDFFKRVPIEQYRVSVVAFYNGAIPVVIDTSDVAVFENIMNELPMQYAFTNGKTDLFSGLEEVAKVTKPWRPRSTSLVVLSDGDTIPGKGMPKMPASISDVVVVGVGDDQRGTFINGEQSRQDVSTLKQLAVRLRGTYINGNDKPLSGKVLGMLMSTSETSALEKLSMREYALWALAIGCSVLAVLPLLLHYFGSTWNPGVKHAIT